MEHNELDELIDKYLKGTASDAESKRLTDWYRGELEGEVVWEMDSLDEESLIKTRISHKIQQALHRDSKVKPVRKRLSIWRWGAITAAAVIPILLWLNPNNTDNYKTFDPTIVNIELNATENRFHLLPDSSTVILRPGSSLEYKTDFSGNTREVVLKGEGYFDIRSNKLKPFIVHTGDIKTIVLGTSFMIRTEDQIEKVQVVVKHGKVRVERKNKVLAELVANQQLNIHSKEAAVQQSEVVADEELAWTSVDLRFDREPFGRLVERLIRRYDVEISFENQELANCPVTGVFKGTETLEEVLTTLCLTRNAKFRKLENGALWITGKGCQ